MNEPWHGTRSGYFSRKCRCDDCRAASREYRREVRSRPAPDHVHGTTGGYNNYRCRCDDCKTAWNAQIRKNQADRVARGVVPESAHGTENGYSAYRCRCDLCMEAHRVRNRDYYARAQSAEARGSLWGKVCVNGHALEGENLYVRKDGKKSCRECQRARSREFYLRKKQQR